MKHFLLLFFVLILATAKASSVLIPMDQSQTNHLKAYGIAYWMLNNKLTIEWLLNYRGGAFLCPHDVKIEEELIIRGVKYEVITDGQANNVRSQISNPDVNQEIIQLEKAPKIAV